MIKGLSLKTIILILAAIMIANAIAYWKHLYFYVRWFDIPMHLISGFWIAATVCSFLANASKHSHAAIDRSVAFFASIGAVMTAGILWELFEFSAKNLIIFDPHEAYDTLSDLANDFLGGILGSLFLLVGRYVPPVSKMQKTEQ